MIYFVPTPIGNLEDITVRAKRVLSESQVVICEDGRVTSKLFNLLGLENKPRFITMVKNHDYNYNQIEKILAEAQSNSELVICVVSDAGTVGISDPGYLVVKRLQELALPYTVLPGATALIPAVVASGLVTKDFWFIGFLPLKKGRAATIKQLTVSMVPVVLYESSHRIKKLVCELVEQLTANSQVFISREISKHFEEYTLLTAQELKNYSPVEKGEFVVVVKPILQA
jgi:16S rRNA (cytidine1402-2'-O)-methyltransferase